MMLNVLPITLILGIFVPSTFADCPTQKICRDTFGQLLFACWDLCNEDPINRGSGDDGIPYPVRNELNPLVSNKYELISFWLFYAKDQLICTFLAFQESGSQYKSGICCNCGNSWKPTPHPPSPHNGGLFTELPVPKWPYGSVTDRHIYSNLIFCTIRFWNKLDVTILVFSSQSLATLMYEVISNIAWLVLVRIWIRPSNPFVFRPTTKLFDVRA